MKIFRILSVFLVLCGLLIPVIGQAQQEQGKDKRSGDLDKAYSRALASAALFREIVEPPSSIPAYILSTAKAVAIISSRPQFGSFTGNENAVGLVTARDPKTGKWTAPIFLTIKGGKIDERPEDIPLEPLLKKKQIDIILLAMNQRAADLFLSEELVLGSDVLVMPGTFGEIAKPGEYVAATSTGVLAYLYNSGQILGVSLEDSSVKQDKTVNNAVYEEKKLDSYLPVDKSMQPRLLSFTDVLNQYYSAYAYK